MAGEGAREAAGEREKLGLRGGKGGWTSEEGGLRGLGFVTRVRIRVRHGTVEQADRLLHMQLGGHWLKGHLG